MKKIILSIDGMTCSACSSGLEKYLKKQEGIESVSVNLVLATASISYDEKKLTIEQLEKFVLDAGFKSLGEFKEMKEDKIEKKEALIFLFYTFLAIFIMYLSMGHMLHLPMIPFLNPEIYPWNYMICLFILSLFFLWYGKDLIKNGYKNLIHGYPNMDTLVMIGVLTSFFYSVYFMIRFFLGDLHAFMNLYFESSCIVIYFIKLGRYLDFLNKRKTKDAIQELVQMTPSNATLKKNGSLVTVTLDEIKIKDIVVSKPGEKIAVDGVVVSGSSHTDESFITGESKPVTKKVGDSVIAGSINYDGYLEYEAMKIGKNSTISEIVKLVVEATNTKPKIASFADLVSGYFVPIVIGISLMTFVFSLLFGLPLEEAFERFVSVLVVACPCNLGLATPLAVVVSEGVCASNKILVKTSEVLENASSIDTVVFDKTGTLTYGKLKIAQMKYSKNKSKKEILEKVRSLESLSTHPIATAFMEEDHSFVPLKVEELENLPGYGISGKIGRETYYVGNEKLIQKEKIKNPYEKEEQKYQKEGHSIVYFSNQKEVLAIFGVNDIVKPSAKNVLKELKKWHIKTIMMTGDHEGSAKRIGSALEIDEVISDVLPKEKASLIQKLKSDGKKVMMCGDGINDSIAITSSFVGVSFSGASDIAMDCADVILTNQDLTSILKLIQISKKTIKVMKQNLFWAFLYNILMIPVAMGLLKGLGISVNPMLASLAMVLSSLTVVLNTLRLRK